MHTVSVVLEHVVSRYVPAEQIVHGFLLTPSQKKMAVQFSQTLFEFKVHVETSYESLEHLALQLSHTIFAVELH